MSRGEPERVSFCEHFSASLSIRRASAAASNAAHSASVAHVVTSQEGPDRVRRLGDVGDEFGRRITYRQRFVAPFLGCQDIVDERAAMQNALLAPERIDLGSARAEPECCARLPLTRRGGRCCGEAATTNRSRSSMT